MSTRLENRIRWRSIRFTVLGSLFRSESSGWVLRPRVAEKDGRIRPDLSDWWLPGPPPCLPHARVSLGEEGEGGVVVLRARSRVWVWPAS